MPRPTTITDTYATGGSFSASQAIKHRDNINGLIQTGIGIFYAAQYGVDVNNTYAQNATFLMQAQTDAENYGWGVVALPGGTFRVDGMAWKPTVSFIGVGEKATNIICPLRSYLLTYSSSMAGSIDCGRFLNINFIGAALDSDGNPPAMLTDNNASYGVLQTMAPIAFFDFVNLRAIGFSRRVFEFDEALIGNFINCRIRQSNYGIRNVGRQGDLANYVNIERCVFQRAHMRAIDWSRGSSVHIIRCDVESCGQNGDLTTGAFRFVDMAPKNEHISVVVEDLYTENNGGVVIDIVGGDGNTSFLLNRAPHWVYDEQEKQATNYIRATANGAGTIEVELQRCNMSGSSGPSVLADGKVKLINVRSQIEAVSYVNGATYQTTSLTDGASSGPTPSPNAQSNYRAAVLALNPVYYNDLAASPAVQPATVGSSPITMSGTVSSRQPGPFAADSTSYAVTISSTGQASVPLDLTSYGAIAISAWVNTGGYAASGGTLFEFGNPNWGEKSGCFVFSPFVNSSNPNGVETYFGFRSSPSTGSTQRAPNMPAGWQQVVLYIAHGQLTTTMYGRTATNITPDSSAPDLGFASTLMQFLDGTASGSLAHVTVFGAANLAALPTPSDFVALYNKAFV